MNDVKIFVISGPSGSGKTSLLRTLFHKKQIKAQFFRVRTVTTRKPRQGERAGRDYYFLDKKKFLKARQEEHFLETKKYLEDFYGTPKDFLDKAEQNKKHPILCIDVEGMQKVKRVYPKKTVSIFILPPSDKELEQRLHLRRTEDTQKVKKRLRIAKKEVKYATKYNYRVTNDDFCGTVEKISGILLRETGRKK